MRTLESIIKFVAAIVIYISSAVTLLFIEWFIVKDFIGVLMAVAFIGAIGVTVFEMKCMYKKGLNAIVVILILMQTIFVMMSDHLGDADESLGLMNVMAADNYLYVRQAVPAVAIVFVLYIVGYFAKIALDKKALREADILAEKQREAQENAEGMRKEREEQQRQAREDAYYEDLKAQKRAYERFTREQHQSDYSKGDAGQQQSSYNQKTGGASLSEYEKAKAMFGLDSDDYTLDQIKRIRNKLIKSFHPDESNDDDSYAKKVNSAFDILKKRL